MHHAPISCSLCGRPRSRSSASTSQYRPVWRTCLGRVLGRVSTAAVCWHTERRALTTGTASLLDVSGTTRTATLYAVPSVQKRATARSASTAAACRVANPHTTEITGRAGKNRSAVARSSLRLIRRRRRRRRRLRLPRRRRRRRCRRHRHRRHHRPAWTSQRPFMSRSAGSWD